jgi:hypothetical protein
MDDFGSYDDTSISYLKLFNGFQLYEFFFGVCKLRVLFWCLDYDTRPDRRWGP